MRRVLQTKTSVCQGEQELGLLLSYDSDKKVPLSQSTRRGGGSATGALALSDVEFRYLLIKVKFTNTAHKSQETSQKVEYKNLKETQSKKN